MHRNHNLPGRTANLEGGASLFAVLASGKPRWQLTWQLNDLEASFDQPYATDLMPHDGAGYALQLGGAAWRGLGPDRADSGVGVLLLTRARAAGH
jgi:hypothetical protein